MGLKCCSRRRDVFFFALLAANANGQLCLHDCYPKPHVARRLVQHNTFTMDFEGLGNNQPVSGFYHDLTGAVFRSSALALIDRSANGTGNFDQSNYPDLSGNTILYFLSGESAIVNIGQSFCQTFSFWYTTTKAGTVSVYSGEDASGSVLASASLTTSTSTANDEWHYIDVTWPEGESAHSVEFSASEANYLGIDNIIFASPVSGSGCDPHIWGVLGQSFIIQGGTGAFPYYAFLHERDVHINVRAAAASTPSDPSYMDGCGIVLNHDTAALTETAAAAAAQQPGGLQQGPVAQHTIAVVTPTEACLRRYSSAQECAAVAAEAAATAAAAKLLESRSGVVGVRGAARYGAASPEDILAAVPCPGPIKVALDGKEVKLGRHSLADGVEVGVFELPHFCKYHRAVFDQKHDMTDTSLEAFATARQRRASALQPTTCPARHSNSAWYDLVPMPEESAASEMREWIMEGLRFANADMERCVEWLNRPAVNLLEANMGGRLTTVIVKRGDMVVRVEHWAMGVAAAAAAVAAAAAEAAAEAAAAGSPAEIAAAAAATAAASAPGDAGAILDVFLYKWRAQKDSHGLLGGTSRFQRDADGRPVLKGQGAFEGTVEDYEVPDLFSTSFKLRP